MFILVRAECPFVQFATAAYIISSERFIVEGTNSRERDKSQVSDGKVERTLRARLLLDCVLSGSDSTSRVSRAIGPLFSV